MPKDPVEEYVRQLEVALRVLPRSRQKESLADAAEHLRSEWESLQRADARVGAGEALEHFEATFGTPDEVAAMYAEGVSESGSGKSWSLAALRSPWLISCGKCGRSKPAERAGVYRIGAWSLHKYTLGYCRSCRRLRFLKIHKASV